MPNDLRNRFLVMVSLAAEDDLLVLRVQDLDLGARLTFRISMFISSKIADCSF